MIKLLEKLKGWNPNDAWDLTPVPTDMSIEPYDSSTEDLWGWTEFPTWRFIKACWADFMISVDEYDFDRKHDPIKLAIAAKNQVAATEYAERLRKES